jgi:hypothetical protein
MSFFQSVDSSYVALWCMSYSAYTCRHTHTHVWMHVYSICMMYAYIHECVHMYINIYTSMHSHEYMHACIHMCMCMYAYESCICALSNSSDDVRTLACMMQGGGGSIEFVGSRNLNPETQTGVQVLAPETCWLSFDNYLWYIYVIIS